MFDLVAAPPETDEGGDDDDPKGAFTPMWYPYPIYCKGGLAVSHSAAACFSTILFRPVQALNSTGSDSMMDLQCYIITERKLYILLYYMEQSDIMTNNTTLNETANTGGDSGMLDMLMDICMHVTLIQETLNTQKNLLINLKIK